MEWRVCAAAGEQANGLNTWNPANEHNEMDRDAIMVRLGRYTMYNVFTL